MSSFISILQKKIPNWLHQQQKRKKSTHNKDQQILKTAQASVWF